MNVYCGKNWSEFIVHIYVLEKWLSLGYLSWMSGMSPSKNMWLVMCVLGKQQYTELMNSLFHDLRLFGPTTPLYSWNRDFHTWIWKVLGLAVSMSIYENLTIHFILISWSCFAVELTQWRPKGAMVSLLFFLLSN